MEDITYKAMAIYNHLYLCPNCESKLDVDYASIYQKAHDEIAGVLKHERIQTKDEIKRLNEECNHLLKQIKLYQDCCNEQDELIYKLRGGK